jgi:hypothetical protein
MWGSLNCAPKNNDVLQAQMGTISDDQTQDAELDQLEERADVIRAILRVKAHVESARVFRWMVFGEGF